MSMPKYALVASTIALSSILSVQALAQSTVSMNSNQDSDAYRLAQNLYSEDLARYRGHSLQTAVIDIDDDNAGELALRIQSGESCSDGYCLTMIAQYDSSEQRWVELLRTETLTPNIRLLPAEDSERQHIVFDDDYAFVWGGESYKRDLSVTMETIDWSRNTDQDVLDAIIRDDNYQYYNPEIDENASIMVGYADINNDGRDETFVRIDSTYSCGSLIGCAVFAYGDLSATPFYQGTSRYFMRVSPDLRNGFKRIIVSNMMGDVAHYWDGNEWTVDRTYYDYDR